MTISDLVTVLFALFPPVGPKAGGTLIVIDGVHLNSSDGPQVAVGNITCPLVNR